MKAKKLICMVTLLFLSSCQSNNFISNIELPKSNSKLELLNINQSFDFSTTKTIKFNFSFKDRGKLGISNAKLKVYSLLNNRKDKLIYTGITDKNGSLIKDIKVPTYYEKLLITSDYIGVPTEKIVDIVDNKVNYEINNNIVRNLSINQPVNFGFNLKQQDFNFIGTWDSNGVPNYLTEKGDTIDSDFLADINASLPEGNPVPNAHPAYLDKNISTSMELVDEADVWVTFVHEGAGWRNSLGYYTYDVNDPPTTPEDILSKSRTIIFPNVSYKGSGGGLFSGDKVHLGKFPAGTGIGWFLAAKGWSNNTVNGIYRVYSNPELNPEKDPDKQQHNVLLKDEKRELFLMGFEDINREWGNCDQDFNDAIFYVKASPYSAVKTSNLPPIDTPKDSDGDGVTDTFDDYPNDSNKAFDNFYPSKNSKATLAFEDLWPEKGDYDFNDLVMNYNFKSITAANGKVSEMDVEFLVKAIGATFKNGLAFELPVDSSKILSVTGSNLSNGIVKTKANGVEDVNITGKSIIPVFENAYDLYSTVKQGSYVNTKKGSSFIDPLKITINIKFTEPVTIDGSAPYNPFIFVNEKREREVHLPDYSPSILADLNLLGTKDDSSTKENSRFYKDKNNLPWAMDLPIDWDYPVEFIPISIAYYHFGKWAESSGENNKDWYLNLSSNRNNNHIYSK